MAKITTLKKKFTQIDNALIYNDDTMSFEALGIYVSCLAREGSWDLCPKGIWGKRKIGRNRTYRAFEEMIEAGYMLRVYTRRTTGQLHLPGPTSYIVVDNFETCRQEALRIVAEEPDVIYLDCSSKFGISQKKLNREVSSECKQNGKIPPSTGGFQRDPGNGDPINGDTVIRETNNKYSAYAVLPKETTTGETSQGVESPVQQAADAVVVFSCIKNLAIPSKIQSDLCSEHTEEQIMAAVKALNASKTKVRSPAAFIRSALKDGYSALSAQSECDKLISEIQQIYAETDPELYLANEKTKAAGHMKIVQMSCGKLTCLQTSLKTALESELADYLKVAQSRLKKKRKSDALEALKDRPLV